MTTSRTRTDDTPPRRDRLTGAVGDIEDIVSRFVAHLIDEVYG